MTQFGLHPVDPAEDPRTCETCGTDMTGQAWYGSVEECDSDGTFCGYSYHCTDCLNVLARMADAVDDLEGPAGKLRLNDEGDAIR